MAKPDAASPSEGDIRQFLSKLEEWSLTLPATQRSVAQALVERGRDLDPRSVALARISSDLRASAKAVIAALNQLDDPPPQAWARIDPIWQRRDMPDPGEEVEMIQRIFITSRVQ
jgi:hypothetical protein